MKRLFLILAVILIAAQGFAQDTKKDVAKGKTAPIWDTLTGPTAGISIPSRTVLSAPEKLVSLVIVSDGRIIANSANNIYVWSLTGQLLKTLPIKSKAIALASAGRYLIACDRAANEYTGDTGSGNITVMDTTHWNVKAEAQGLGMCIGAPSLPLAATWGYWKDELIVWNFETGEKRRAWSGPHGKKETPGKFYSNTWQSVRDAAFSPDGRFIAIAREAHNSDDQLVIIETAFGKKVKAFFNCSNDHNTLAAVEYSAAGNRLVTNGFDCSILVREADTGITLGRFKNENNGWSVPAPRFSPDGRYVFFFDRRGGHFRYSDGSKGGLDIAEARQVDTASGTESKLEITEEKVADALDTSPSFSPDGKRLAWIENNNVHIWDMQGIGPVSAP